MLKRLSVILLCLCFPAIAQNVRWDYQATATNTSVGNLIPLYVLPNARITFYSGCTLSGCSTLASVYNTFSSVTACPTNSQVVLNQSTSCGSTADSQGNFGGWFQPGNYQYTVQTSSGTFGPYWFSVGGSSGSSFTLNTLSGAVTLVAGSGIVITPSGNTLILSTLCSPFTINSFSGGSSVELGTSITNPAFTSSYSCLPTSANITNTESIDSPLTLTTPFTSGTVVGTFTHATTTTTTFTLTAIQASTQTATQTLSWNPRIFGGVGATGATSSVTASGTTAILSTSDVLSSAGLEAETVGQIFGPFMPSSQNIYLLLIGGSHTFTDTCTGFPLPFNSPTSISFVNFYGVTVSMFLYQSTNSLIYTSGCAFTPKVSS